MEEVNVVLDVLEFVLLFLDVVWVEVLFVGIIKVIDGIEIEVFG